MQTLPKTLTSHNHGIKIKKQLDPYTPRLLERVRETQLEPLLETYHTICDNALLSAFIERWHADTSSFHLPFGEMTVTLHDISNLLHLPIRGIFPSAEIVGVDEAIQLAMECFGVTYADAHSHMAQGPYYLFSWLQDLLRVHMDEAGDEDIALRLYLLQLLSYSIFTNKGSNRAEAKLLLLLRDLRRTGQWAWGVGALVNLYHEMSFSSLAVSSHLSGFPALLQAWIAWYFPKVWKRTVAVAGSSGLAGRWRKQKTNETVVDCRRMVDQLTTEDVCWTPFEGQDNGRELDSFSLFTGWLSWGELRVPYMPDRCLRQFGYRQHIPRPPLRHPRPPYSQIMRGMAEFMDVVGRLVAEAQVATYPSEVVEGYLQWYVAHSYPRLMGDVEEEQEEPTRPDDPPPTDGAPVPEHLPQWVDDIVRFVREGLQSQDIVPRSHTYGRLYAMVGYPRESQTHRHRHRGTGRQHPHGRRQ